VAATVITEGGAQQIAFLVDRFASATADVTGALVLSTDGVRLAASLGLRLDQADRFAATASGVLSLSGAVGREFGFEGFQQSILRYGNGHVIVTALDQFAALAVITQPDAKLGQVSYEMSLFAQRVGALLTPEVRRQLGGGPVV
jgi:predicted regulator of Ras-like GTPase activity (Roadblock/LC7/MglB family)